MEESMHDEHDRNLVSERITELANLYLRPSPYVEYGKGGADLATLAEQINAEHEACDAAMRDGLRHALKAGELLTEAKGRVKHGGWGDWLRLNFKGSARTARAYMQAAREFAALPEGERQRVAVLPYRDLLKLLGETAADTNADGRAATEAVAEMKERAGEAGDGSVLDETEEDSGVARIARIRKAANMEYVVEWTDGIANTVQRKTLAQQGYRKCGHCSGYGVVR